MIFPIKLQRLTLVRIARMVLEQAKIKESIMHCFLCQKWDKRDIDNFPYSEFNSIIASSLAFLNNFTMPLTLNDELKDAIISMGMKMFHWFEYACELYEYNFQKATSCMKIICWTHYGGIDYRKTFELSWLDNDALTKRDIFVMACNYCFEDHMLRHWEPMTVNPQPYSYASSLAAYWQAYFDGNMEFFHTLVRSLDEFNDVFELFDYCKEVFTYGSPDGVTDLVAVLGVAIYQGHSEAVKFFWRHLSSQEKRRYIIQLICALLQIHGYWRQEGYAYSCIYLLQQIIPTDVMDIADRLRSMSPEAIRRLSIRLFEDQSHSTTCIFALSCCTQFLSSFLCVWPWQECFIPVLQQLWTVQELWYPGFNGLDVAVFMEQIPTAMLHYYGEIGDSIGHIPSLYRIWRMIPTKIKLLSQHGALARLIFSLMASKDWHTLKAIITDQDLIAKKRRFVVCGIASYLQLVDSLDFGLVNNVLSIVSTYEWERIAIRSESYVWDYFADCDHKYMVNGDSVRWQCKSIDNYYKFRSGIDVTTRWKDLLDENGDVRAGDEFIKWYFRSSVDYIKAFKHSISITTYPYEFIINCWFKYWFSQRVKNSARNSRQFLYWMFHDDDDGAITDFLRTKLLEYCRHILTPEYCLYYGSNGLVRRQEFFSWCLLDVKISEFMEEN